MAIFSQAAEPPPHLKQQRRSDFAERTLMIDTSALHICLILSEILSVSDRHESSRAVFDSLMMNLLQRPANQVMLAHNGLSWEQFLVIVSESLFGDGDPDRLGRGNSFLRFLQDGRMLSFLHMMENDSEELLSEGFRNANRFLPNVLSYDDIGGVYIAVLGHTDAMRLGNNVLLNASLLLGFQQHDISGLLGHELIHIGLAQHRQMNPATTDSLAHLFLRHLLEEGWAVNAQLPFHLSPDTYYARKWQHHMRNLRDHAIRLDHHLTSARTGPSPISCSDLHQIWLEAFGPGYAVGWAAMNSAETHYGCETLVELLEQDPNPIWEWFKHAFLVRRGKNHKASNREPFSKSGN